MADHDQIGTERNAHSGTAGKDKSSDVKADSSGTSNNTEHNDKSNAQEAHKHNESEAERVVKTEADKVKQDKQTEQRETSEKHGSMASAKIAAENAVVHQAGKTETEKPDKTSRIVTNKTENAEQVVEVEANRAEKTNKVDETSNAASSKLQNSEEAVVKATADKNAVDKDKIETHHSEKVDESSSTSTSRTDTADKPEKQNETSQASETDRSDSTDKTNIAIKMKPDAKSPEPNDSNTQAHSAALNDKPNAGANKLDVGKQQHNQPQAQEQPQSQPPAQPEPKPQAQSQPQAQPQTQPQPETQAPAQAQAQDQSKAQPQAQAPAQHQTQPQPETQILPQAQNEPHSQTQPQAQADLDNKQCNSSAANGLASDSASDKAAATTQSESSTPTCTSTQKQNETSADKTEPATQSTHEQSANADQEKGTGKNADKGVSTGKDTTAIAKNAKETIEQKVKQTKEELEQKVKQAKEELELKVKQKKEELEQKMKQTKEELELKMKKSFKFLGIEFAPVLLPIERRLQTLAVLGYLSFITTFPVLLLLLFIISLFTSWLYLPLVYGMWMIIDRHTPHRGGRRYEIMRRLPIWRYFRDYFPIRLTKTADLNPSRNYLIGFHPHGILAFGAMINFCTEATNFSKLFPGIRTYVLTLNSNFRLPVMRAYFMSLGFCAVSRESIKHILTSGKGHAAVIVVGGAEEGLEARPGSYTIVLRYRKGFVRQAIRAGADLVPCYSFGENDMYKQIENNRGSKLRNFQEWFKRTMGFSPPIIYGRGVFNYSFGLMPYRCPVNTIVGKPIRVDRDDNPSNELVDHYHQLYMDALHNLFEENKVQHDIPDDIHLQFV